MATGAISVSTLQEMHQQIIKKDGLLDFTRQLREPKKANLRPKITVKVEDLISRFDKNELWIDLSKGGHANYQNKIFKKIHVGFRTHGSTEVYGKHLEGILQNIQDLINILCDKVFATRNKNWLDKPDFKEALARYNNMNKKDEEKK